MSSGNVGTIAYALIQVCKVPLCLCRPYSFVISLDKQTGNELFSFLLYPNYLYRKLQVEWSWDFSFPFLNLQSSVKLLIKSETIY